MRVLAWDAVIKCIGMFDDKQSHISLEMLLGLAVVGVFLSLDRDQ
jgi:hypothetical protein